MSVLSQSAALDRSTVDRILARHGLLAGPRSLRDRNASKEPLSPEIRLHSALAELGPAASLFGRYLSSRMDVLPISQAEILADLPSTAPPKADRLGPDMERRFAAVDPRACGEGLAWVGFRALTADGRSVEVRKYDAGAIESLRRDVVELQAGLGRVLGDRPWALPFDRLWSDFRRRDLEPRLDPWAQIDRLQRLATEAERIDDLQLPRVDPELSTDGLLVLEMPVAAKATEESEAQRRHALRALTRRAVDVWLQAVVTGGLFPVSAQWILDSRGRVVLVDGTFAEPAAGQGLRVWDYLRALARQEPDRCYQILVRELDPPPSWGTGEQHRALRSAFRYSVPFRDGSWTRAGDSLAEMAIHHWRACAQAGFRIPDVWCDFFRALILRSRETQNTEGYDAVHEALDALQWRAGWNQLRLLTEPRALPSAAKRYATALLDLPQALEHLLDPKESIHRQVEPLQRSPSRLGSSAQALIGAVLGWVAVALALPTIVVTQPKLEVVGVGILGLLGLLVWILIFRDPAR